MQCVGHNFGDLLISDSTKNGQPNQKICGHQGHLGFSWDLPPLKLVFNQVHSNKIAPLAPLTTLAAHRFLLHGRLRQLASPPSHRVLQTFQCTAHLNQTFRWILEKKTERPKSLLIYYDIFKLLLLFFQFKSSKFEFTLRNTQKHTQYLLRAPRKVQKAPLRNTPLSFTPPKRHSARFLNLKNAWSFLFETLYPKTDSFPLQKTWMLVGFLQRWFDVRPFLKPRYYMFKLNSSTLL